mgnify:CR=1 FL=1|jgi:acyl carrier protein
METLTAELKNFIATNFLFGQSADGLTEDRSFLESGIIDSTGMLELVSFVEQTYGISVKDNELLPENLDSLRNLSQFVARKREAAAVKAQG